MKHLKLVILLAFICWNTFEISAQNKIDRFSHTAENDSILKKISKNIKIIYSTKKDSVSISKPQIKNIYIGLKQLEAYKKYYYECLQGSNELKEIINQQDVKLQKSVKNIYDLNIKTDSLNRKIIETEVNIQKLKNKKIPFWKHPILYGLLGFVSGIYLMK